MLKPHVRAGTLHVTTALAALIIVSAGCSGKPAQRAAQQAAAESRDSDQIPDADRSPASLRQVGQSAMDLFDAAWSSDWPRAADSLQALNEADLNLPADLPKPDLVAQLQSRVATVRNAANARQRVETMDAANAITRIVAELSAEYQCAVLYETQLLGYYVRQIEVGIGRGRVATIARASTDLEAAWNRIRPVIEQRGQIDDARQFTDIVVDLVGATRPADFGPPARAALAAVDRLESSVAASTGEPCSEAPSQ
jgi:hypothetical protein